MGIVGTYPRCVQLVTSCITTAYNKINVACEVDAPRVRPYIMILGNLRLTKVKSRRRARSATRK